MKKGPVRDFGGRHAVVTGAGRGIGAAVAVALARRGANVTLLGRDRARLAETAEAIVRDHGVKTHVMRCDVENPNSIQSAFAEARRSQGDIAILINNAGIAEVAAVKDLTREMWDQHLAVNATGPLLCIQQVLPAMLAARAGRIVNIASTAGLRGVRQMGAYVASKHALVGLTRTLALETAKHGITVNAVCPGYTDTDMAGRAQANLEKSLGKSPEEARAMLVRTIPRGTLIQPGEVADAVLWLCSDGASAVTGQCIVVAGGEGT